MKINRRNFIKRGTIFGASLPLGLGLLAKNADMPGKEPCLDIFGAIKRRRSVRKFKSTPVPEEHLKRILSAANYAPSPRNRQAWKFVVIRERKVLDQIKEACIKRTGERARQYFSDFLSAPVYVVVVASTKTRNPINDFIGGALAAQNLMLAARALGYGTVYSANSIPEAVTKEVLNIPDEYKRVCVTPVGVPVEWPKSPPKKDLKDVLIHNKFA